MRLAPLEREDLLIFIIHNDLGKAYLFASISKSQSSSEKKGMLDVDGSLGLSFGVWGADCCGDSIRREVAPNTDYLNRFI